MCLPLGWSIQADELREGDDWVKRQVLGELTQGVGFQWVKRFRGAYGSTVANSFFAAYGS